MNVQTKRKVLLSVLATAILAAVIYGFLPGSVPTDVTVVKKGPLRVTVCEQGQTRLQDRFIITAPVAGYLQRVKLKAGDPVERGAEVAFLEPLRSQVLDPRSRAEAELSVSAAQQALLAAEARELAAKAEAEYAHQRWKRMNNLYGNEGYIAKDTLEQADAEAKRAQAVYLSAGAAAGVARADLNKARNLLKNYANPASGRARDLVTVASPVGGRVLRVFKESEGAVNVGEPVMEVGNPEKLDVRVDVLSADAVQIKKGTPVLFERWGGDNALEGTVRTVEPGGFTKISSLGVEEQRVVVIVDITTPAEVWQKLGDGYRLEASFIIWEDKDVLQVPASALFRTGNQWAVFVDSNGKARRRLVQIGRQNGLATQILAGLKAGDSVVTHPDDAIEDGTSIRAKR